MEIGGKKCIVRSNEPTLRNQGWRTRVNDQLPERLKFDTIERRPGQDEFEVVFGVISRSPRTLVLPFFSRVNLKNASHYLIAFGFKVALTKIQST